MSSRPFLCLWKMYYHQQLCVYKISFQTPQTIFHLTHHCVFTKISSQFSLLAAIHLFARSVTKSKISTSPAKKLVAATCGVYVLLQLYKHMYASVAGRHCVSSRPFLCTRNMYYYQQRCVNTISTPKSIPNKHPHQQRCAHKILNPTLNPQTSPHHPH